METIIGQSGGNGEAAAPGLIKDSNQQDFGRDVIEASMKAPVLVDFWAPWCGPCKQLGPVLEKVVSQARGAIRMVKINVDENQMLAQQLRVQSIPMVVVFYQGRPVDGFQGALPESEVKAFVARLIGDQGPDPVEEMMKQAAEAFDGGDIERAAALFAEVLKADRDNVKAVGGLAKSYVRLGELDAAKELLDGVPKNAAGDPEVAAARAALALASDVQHAGEVEPARKAVDAAPDDHKAMFDLALALIKAQQYDEAADLLVDMVRRDRDWNEAAARKQLLKLFEVFGPTNPFTLRARRKLSSVLFS